MKKYFWLLSCCLLLATSRFAVAQTGEGLILSPQIIDEKAKVRDILKYDLKLENKTDHKVSLYPTVYDLNESGAISQSEESKLDYTNSLTHWLTITRGVTELMPQEVKTLPMEISIPTTAIPGKYYATIVFPDGPTRVEAESLSETTNFPKVNLNIQVEDNMVENAQIVSTNYKNIFFKQPVDFLVKIKNNGNIEVAPKGNLLIYDRRGAEVKDVAVGGDDMKIQPGETKDYDVALDNFFSSGKYKAKLEMSYGQKTVRDLQDAMFFWILPWQKLLIFIFIVIVAIVLLVMFIYKKTYQPMPQQTAQFRKPMPQGPGVINLKK